MNYHLISSDVNGFNEVFKLTSARFKSLISVSHFTRIKKNTRSFRTQTEKLVISVTSKIKTKILRYNIFCRRKITEHRERKLCVNMEKLLVLLLLVLVQVIYNVELAPHHSKASRGFKSMIFYILSYF